MNALRAPCCTTRTDQFGSAIDLPEPQSNKAESDARVFHVKEVTGPENHEDYESFVCHP